MWLQEWSSEVKVSTQVALSDPSLLLVLSLVNVLDECSGPLGRVHAHGLESFGPRLRVKLARMVRLIIHVSTMVACASWYVDQWGWGRGKRIM